MTTMTHSSARRSPETVDRLMVGVCGAVWLAFLVVAVIATVACVNLGRGRGGVAEESSGLLYTIIGISAVTILAAVPLLLRARRDAMAGRVGDEPAPAVARAPAVVAEAPTEKIQVFGSAVDPMRGAEPELPQAVSDRAAAPVAADAANRNWLRGTLSILGGMGLALTAVAAATYLLAVGADTAGLAALVVAGLVTLATPAALVVFSRRLADAPGA